MSEEEISKAVGKARALGVFIIIVGVLLLVGTMLLNDMLMEQL